MLLTAFALGCGFGAVLVCCSALLGEWMSKRGRRTATTLRVRDNVVDLRGAGWPR